MLTLAILICWLFCVWCSGQAPASWTNNQAEDHYLTTTLTTTLAPVVLSPPDGNKAVINIIPSTHQQLLQWARDMPAHLVAAAAHDTTGTSSKTAADMSEEERWAAVKSMLLLNVVVEMEEGAAGHEDM